MPLLLDPKNDFVFKRLFAASPELLADLINAVRSDEPPVEVTEVLNPRIDPEELTGKFIVLDVLACDAAGRFYNIEMQVRRHAGWNARSTYYLARTLTNQLKNGDDYTALKPVIGIHLLDFDLFDVPEQAFWCFELRDRLRPQVALEGQLQLNVIELLKADRLLPQPGALSAWIAWFEHWQEENTMSTITHPAVRQAMEELRHLSEDDEARRLAFVRERALRDEVSLMNTAREEGREEGVGLGVRQEREAALLRILELKFGPVPDTIRGMLRSASLDELLQLFDKALRASQLDEVIGT